MKKKTKTQSKNNSFFIYTPLLLIALMASPFLSACPSDIKVFVWHVKIASTGTPGLTLEVDGFDAVGSQKGDSCASAVVFPKGLTATSVAMVDSITGSPVGFGEFAEDSLATLGFCPPNNSNCLAFTANVEREIPAGTLLKMVVEVVSDNELDNQSATQTAIKISRRGMIIAGGVDESGLPTHHLAIAKPPGIELSFSDTTHK